MLRTFKQVIKWKGQDTGVASNEDQLLVLVSILPEMTRTGQNGQRTCMLNQRRLVQKEDKDDQ